MRGTDSHLGVEQPPAGAGAGTGERAPEEGLATALSAFLAQLHSGLDEPQSLELSTYPAWVPEVRDEVSLVPAGPTLPFGRPVGGLAPLAHRKGAAPRLSGASPAEAHAPAPIARPTPATGTAAPTGKGRTHPVPLREEPAPPKPSSWAPGPRLAATQAAAPSGAAGPGPSVASQAPPKARHETHSRRKTALAALTAAAVIVAGLGVWGHSKANALNHNSRQLAATTENLVSARSSLVSARSSLGVARHRIATQRADLRTANALINAERADLRTANALVNAERADLRSADLQVTSARSQLATVQAALIQTEGRLTQAQDRVGQAQGQLVNTQQNLSATQSHATQWQQDASIGQQTVQLLSSLILLENDYLAAAQAKNTKEMQKDLGQMRTLDAEAQALRPELPGPAR